MLALYWQAFYCGSFRASSELGCIVSLLGLASQPVEGNPDQLSLRSAKCLNLIVLELRDRNCFFHPGQQFGIIASMAPIPKTCDRNLPWQLRPHYAWSP